MAKNIIIHILINYGGGTEKYVNEIKIMFPNYNHKIIGNYPFSLDDSHDDIVLVHLHSAFPDVYIGWNVLNIIGFFRSIKHDMPVYITLHDYQWVIKEKPYLSTYDNMQECIECYRVHNHERTATLFDMVDRIFVPSYRVFENYRKIMGNDMKLAHINKMHVVPHCDRLVRLEQLYVPMIQQHTINIAFVGLFIDSKGRRLFIDLFNHYRRTDCDSYKIKYHVFGDHCDPQLSENAELREHVQFHGKYNDSSITDELYSNNIHIVVFFSILEETYCYALTHLINSGLIMVYLNRGSLTTRINSGYPRMFPFEEMDYYRMRESINSAIGYLLENQGRKDLVSISSELFLSNEYRELYIPHVI